MSAVQPDRSQPDRPDNTLSPIPHVRSRPPWPSALPSPLTPMIGREREVAAVAALLARDDVRLVTLTGAGGVGKTRLALHVGNELEHAFADGVAFAGLAAISDPDLVLPTIAATLGVREAEDRSLIAELQAVLRSRHVLIVLDNFEQVVGAAPALTGLLGSCPRIKLLVTSRARLRVSGERAYPVPPLTVPEPAAHAERTAERPAAESEAVRLFAARAAAANPDFRRSAANDETIAEICRRLDGLPLPIELAARRVAMFTPAALLARLERRLPLLTGGPRDAPAHQRTLHATIAWSYDLLSPAERSLFRRLAVFVGGFNLDAAEEVGRGRPQESRSRAEAAASAAPAGDGLVALDASTVLSGVSSLVEQSLLWPQPIAGADEVAEPRFLMLETLREFGLEELGAREDADETRRRHVAYFLGLAERAAAEASGAEGKVWQDQLERDHDNLRAALTWTIEHDVGTALRLGAALRRFWGQRSYWTEGRRWLARALERAGGGATPERAAALLAAGVLASVQGDCEQAGRCLEESLALWGRLDNPREAARTQRELGVVASYLGRFDRASGLFEAALARSRLLRDQDAIGRCLSDLAVVSFRLDDYVAAVSWGTEALATARDTGDLWLTGVVLGNLSGAYDRLGDETRAAALTEEALDLARRLDDAFGVAFNQFHLATYARRRGRFGEALHRLNESLTVTLELDEKRLLTRVFDNFADVAAGCGQAEAAARLLGAAVALREAAGDALFPTEEAELAPVLAKCREVLGDAVFGAAWKVGQELTLEAAAATARTIATTRPDPPKRDRRAEPPPPAADALLTGREAEVLRLLVDGLTDRQIAAALFISRPTASKHVASILGKLGADSRAGAAAIAVRDRLV
jgi:predicted ATPase/DNA-binding CsgD family transcriptional regulator